MNRRSACISASDFADGMGMIAARATAGARYDQQRKIIIKERVSTAMSRLPWSGSTNRKGPHLRSITISY